MTMQSDLRACLLPLAGNRVYFSVLPLEVAKGDLWPCIVIAADISTADPSLCGTEDDHRMQIDVYDRRIGNLIESRSSIFAAIESQFPESTRLSDMADYDAETKLHRRIIEYLIPVFN